MQSFSADDRCVMCELSYLPRCLPPRLKDGRYPDVLTADAEFAIMPVVARSGRTRYANDTVVPINSRCRASSFGGTRQDHEQTQCSSAVYRPTAFRHDPRPRQPGHPDTEPRPPGSHGHGLYQRIHLQPGLRKRKVQPDAGPVPDEHRLLLQRRWDPPAGPPDVHAAAHRGRLPHALHRQDALQAEPAGADGAGESRDPGGVLPRGQGRLRQACLQQWLRLRSRSARNPRRHVLRPADLALSGQPAPDAVDRRPVMQVHRGAGPIEETVVLLVELHPPAPAVQPAVSVELPLPSSHDAAARSCRRTARPCTRTSTSCRTAASTRATAWTWICCGS